MIKVELGPGVDPGLGSVVERVCLEVEPRVRAALPGLAEDMTVMVMATDRGIIPETGTGGSSYSPGRISFAFDPSRSDGPEALIRAWLPSTLFHELHHQARGWVMHGGTGPDPFIHGAICEGLATAFERDETGQAPPWADYPPEAKEWAVELLALPMEYNYVHWMFAHPDGRRWVGYRTGTFIADRAMAASGMGAGDLATVPTPDILAMAGLAEARR